MKKTLLSVALFATFSSLFAQREVGDAIRIDLQLPASRGTDTLVLGSYGGGLQVLGSNNGGFVAGSNGYGDMAKAQEFHLDDQASLDELLFFFAKSVTTGGASSTIKAVVYDLTGMGATSTAADAPAPGGILAESAPVSIDAIDTTGLFGITLGPVMVQDFAAGIDVSGLATDDHVGMAHTNDGDVIASDRSWELWSDGDWHTMFEAWPLDIDFFVLPVLTAAWVGVEDGHWVNGMRMSIRGGNPVADQMQIAFENEVRAEMNIRVIDAAGRTVVMESLGVRAPGLHNYDLNVSDWNAGSYYVTLTSNGRPMTLKLVKK